MTTLRRQATSTQAESNCASDARWTGHDVTLVATRFAHRQENAMSVSARVVILVWCLQGRWCVDDDVDVDVKACFAAPRQSRNTMKGSHLQCCRAWTPSQSPVVDLSMRLQASFLLSVVQSMHKVAHTRQHRSAGGGGQRHRSGALGPLESACMLLGCGTACSLLMQDMVASHLVQ